MKILLVEDDQRISNFIVKGLEENNFRVVLASSAEEARDIVFEDDFDLIILDIMLPGINGIELTKMIRYKKNMTPILILSALNEANDKVDALDNGADDFLVKPFHFIELVSRINALTRRTKYSKNYISDTVLQAHHLTINLDKFEAYQDGEQLNLSPKEFKLLLYLFENKNKVVSRSRILESVWGIRFNNNTNVVDVYISYLRNKLKETESIYIRTVKGAGYMLIIEI